MRHVVRRFVHHLKWPVRVLAFIVHMMHHLAAFFAWTWMLVQVAGTVAQVGLHAGKIWETGVLDSLARDGLAYFTAASGIEWQKLMAIAVVPAFLVALRNSWRAYEQLHAWAHDHHRPAPHA